MSEIERITLICSCCLKPTKIEKREVLKCKHCGAKPLLLWNGTKEEHTLG